MGLPVEFFSAADADQAKIGAKCEVRTMGMFRTTRLFRGGINLNRAHTIGGTARYDMFTQ